MTIPSNDRVIIKLFASHELEDVFAEFSIISAEMEPKGRQDVLATYPTLDVPVMESYILRAYTQYVQNKAGSISPEKCAEQLADAIPVRSLSCVCRLLGWETLSYVSICG